jgi:hypothetical protein
MKDGKYIKHIAALTTFLAIAPIILYIYKFGDGTLSIEKDDWGTFGDFVGGLLNPLISLLTLAVTVYIAFTFNEYERRRDEQSKNEADVKSFLELYQYFVGNEFREKRHIGWNVARRAVQDPDYADFLVKENFVCRYTERLSRKEVYHKFNYMYQKKSMEDFLWQESEDRHKFDAVINFFQLLAVKDVPKKNAIVYDFYYDSWRPILCWYAKKLEEVYHKYPENKDFNNPPNLIESIKLLDKNYYEVPKKSEMVDHPILNNWMNSNTSAVRQVSGAIVEQQ